MSAPESWMEGLSAFYFSVLVVVSFIWFVYSAVVCCIFRYRKTLCSLMATLENELPAILFMPT